MTVSWRDQILTAFPFGNELVDVEYTGEELWSIFEGIVSEENSEGEVRLIQHIDDKDLS